MKYYSGVILVVIISCAVLINVSNAKKRASPPKWKSSSLPFQNERFQSQLEGSSVKLDCKSQGHPKPTIRWMKDGIPIRKGTPNMSTRKYGLMLENITVDMSGNYSCFVENKHGAIEWTFFLDVQATVWPLVVEGPKNITQMVGANVAFQCRILNDPKATIRWQRVNKKKGSKRSKSETTREWNALPDGIVSAVNHDQFKGLVSVYNRAERDGNDSHILTKYID